MALYIRSPTIASRVFGLDSPGQYFRSVPRTKFLFKAEFFLNPAAQNMMQNINLNSLTDISSIAFKVRQIDKPKITLTSQELNNYNRKRIVYSKVEYGDASIRIFDTVDNSLLNVWVNYFTYYFGDSRTKTDMAAAMSPVDAKFVDDTGWGFRPLSEETNFFSKISVSAYWAQTVTKFSYINPKITNIDWTQKDYSSSEMEETTVTFKYEYLTYEKFGQPINEETGFWPVDTLDNSPQPTCNALTAQPRLFTESDQKSSQYNSFGVLDRPKAFGVLDRPKGQPTTVNPSSGIVPGNPDRSINF